MQRTMRQTVCAERASILSLWLLLFVFVRLLSHSTIVLHLVKSGCMFLVLICFFKVGFYSRYGASPGTLSVDQTDLKLTEIRLFIVALE